MEDKKDKKQSVTSENVKPKIVNLCEDMNPHTHNKESYEKLTQQKTSEKK